MASGDARTPVMDESGTPLTGESERPRLRFTKKTLAGAAVGVAVIVAVIVGVVVATTGGGGSGPAPAPKLSCNVTNCETCATRTSCSVCKNGYNMVDDQTCSFQCSKGQEGCWDCTDSETCRTCRPGYSLNGKKCFPLGKMANISYYMYHAVDDQNYPLGSADIASLAGVMWYIHNEVVECTPRGTCTRKFGISRILRYRLVMRNPDSVFAERAGQFGRFVMFDKAKCTSGGPDGESGCEGWWEKYGYFVGCSIPASKTPGDNPYGPNSAWYSLPGPCPEKDFTAKSPTCMKQQPGGECENPDGSNTCTWSAEPAGEVTIDELEGLKVPYHQWCLEGGCEYDRATDKGVRTDFWDGFHDLRKNFNRTMALRRLFAKKYPDMPEDLPEPVCDGF